MHGIN